MNRSDNTENNKLELTYLREIKKIRDDIKRKFDQKSGKWYGPAFNEVKTLRQDRKSEFRMCPWCWLSWMSQE